MGVEQLELRPEVAAFAQAMERKLRANDHKGGWKGTPWRRLSVRLDQEVDELNVAANCGEPPEKVLDEAADVANFAMFISDVCGGLKP